MTANKIERVPTGGPTPSSSLRPILVLAAITLVSVACIVLMWWYFTQVTAAAEPPADAQRVENGN